MIYVLMGSIVLFCLFVVFSVIFPTTGNLLIDKTDKVEKVFDNWWERCIIDKIKKFDNWMFDKIKK